MKKSIVIGGAILIAVVMFAAGVYGGPLMARSLGIRTTAGFAGAAGGPMANLSSEDREKVQNMTEEERRQYFQEQMGGQVPAGAAGRRMGAGMTVEGTVIEAASDTLTVKTDAGGSQVVYHDDDTIIAYAKGREQTDLATGDKVLLVAEPEGDNVLSARAIVVK